MDLFVDCNRPLIEKLNAAAEQQTVLNMETEFCSVSLDIIGKAVFDYSFGSVQQESPVVKAVYRALQEAEHRSTSFIPYWNLPFAKLYNKKLRDFEANMDLLNKVLDELIVKALDTREVADVEELESRDYNEIENTSLLRFLVDMRGEDTSSRQLRDDLMTMLIAGHETTAAVLTWTFYELSQNPALLARVQLEIDTVLAGRSPSYDDMINLPLVRMCLAETLRMYPEPPLLIRRALVDDELPRGGAARKTFIPKGSDIFISTWNLHRSPLFWEHPNVYDPDRFLRNFSNPSQTEWAGFSPGGGKQLYPNEVHSDFAFLPFGGGSRKCVGDQFAMMESISTISLILQQFELVLAIPSEQVGMRTGERRQLRVVDMTSTYSDYNELTTMWWTAGATIHTENGLMMKVKLRPRQHHNTKQSYVVAGGHNTHPVHAQQMPVPSLVHNPAVMQLDSREDTTFIDSSVKQPSKCPFH
jgi:cytochrome P450